MQSLYRFDVSVQKPNICIIASHYMRNPHLLAHTRQQVQATI